MLSFLIGLLIFAVLIATVVIFACLIVGGTS